MQRRFPERRVLDPNKLAYAVRIDSGWRVTDDTHTTITDLTQADAMTSVWFHNYMVTGGLNFNERRVA